MKRDWIAAGMLCILALGASPVCADTQHDIQSSYDRACEAMRLKWIGGVFSIRAHGFQAFNLEGRLIKPNDELKTLAGLLEKAATVNEVTHIVKFTQAGAGEAVVQVSDSIRMYFPASNTQKAATVIIQSVAEDRWIRDGTAWKLKQTHLLRQRAGSDNEFPALGPK